VKSGHYVEVINAKLTTDKLSTWSKDAQLLHEKNHVHSLPTSYPEIIKKIPKTLFQKIQYRLSLEYLKLKVKGNLYDKSSLWHLNLIPFVQKKLNEGFDTIICTAAPFHYLGEVAQLKVKFSSVNFIADFRDPWANNRISYGISDLNQKRLHEEKHLESSVFESFDYLICVDTIHETYIKGLNINPNKIKVIPNGFDPEDFSNIDTKKKQNSRINIVFTGSLYSKALTHLEALYKLLLGDKDLKQEFVFNFYGSIPKEAHYLFDNKALQSTLIFHGKVSLKEVGEKIVTSDLAMLFLTDDLNYTKSTKFYEYIHLRKKIAVFSKYGPISQYIVNNKIGYSIEPRNIRESLLKIKKDYHKDNLNVPQDYSIEKYSIPTLLNNLTNLLN
jgi:glycosyltransferase involved in cell wall biosynthesis|tara:strand:+ start:5235 stop:6395 length:1161 start_codon:yes stop_codon:yes gene_type:complete